MIDLNRLPLDGEGGLIELLRTVKDPRQRRGVRHPLVTVVALAGARSFKAVAEWAKDLTRDTLRRLGSQRWTAPSEPTLRRVLQKLDAERFDAAIGRWLLEQCAVQGPALSVDGKTLRGARDADQLAPHLLSAILHQEGLVVAQRAVGEKTNEIRELPCLLEPLPLAGAVVTADAEPTQRETTNLVTGEWRTQTAYGLTSLIPGKASPAAPRRSPQHRRRSALLRPPSAPTFASDRPGECLIPDARTPGSRIGDRTGEGRGWRCGRKAGASGMPRNSPKNQHSESN